MCAWIVPPVAGLIEPAQAPEFYIDMIGAIEQIGPSCIRVYLVVEQMPLEAGSGVPQKVVIAKIVRPMAGLPSTIARIAQCLDSERSPDIQQGGKPRLVR